MRLPPSRGEPCGTSCPVIFRHGYCRAGRHRRHAAFRAVPGVRGLRSGHDRLGGLLVPPLGLRARRRTGRPLPAGTRSGSRPPPARRHGDRAGVGRRRHGSAGRAGRRGTRGSRRGRPRGVPLHGCLRARRRRSAGRQAGDHALGPHAGAGQAPPPRDGGPGRPLRGRRERADLRRQGRRDGPVPAPRTPRPRLLGRQHPRPAARRAAAPGRRSGPVRHHARPRPGQPPARRALPVGGPTPGPPTHRRGHGTPGTDEFAQPEPPLQDG